MSEGAGTLSPMDVTWPVEDPERIVVAGDWHGNVRAARNAITLAARVGATVVVQLGDFGMWPGTEGAHYLREVEAAARHDGIHVSWIDGNHEDFPQLYAHPIGSDGLRHISDHLHHLPRGSGWTWHGTRFRALGGATSLDRLHRVAGTSWWPEEHITDEDLAAAAAQGPCDVLLTHDCPAGVDIPGIRHRDYADGIRSGWPLSELEQAWGHRERLAELLPVLKPTHLWHGHFHVRYSTTATLHTGGDTRVEGLGDDGAGPDGNLLVATINNAGITVGDAGAASGAGPWGYRRHGAEH